MRLIYQVIKNFFSKEPQIGLGRWNITYEIPKINIKANLANEDHCGPCGEYILEKNNKKIENFSYYKNEGKIKNERK